MKVIALTIAVIALAASLAACGQSADTQGKDQKSLAKGSDAKSVDQMAMSKGSNMKDMDHKSMDGKSGTTHAATGTVKNVDPKSETVTLDHGPVPTLKWPAMTMGFKVRDKAVLDKLQPGKKVEFEFVQQGRDYVITGVK
jgi:Cu(I)/Ag(I) efflux system protein CusF